MSKQPFTFRPMLNDLNPDALCYYLFTIFISRCDGSCNTAEHPVDRIRVPYEMENLKLKVLNVVKGVNKSRTLLKHV